MDYEKKYKEALGRAKNLHKDAIDMEENSRAKLCEIIFPELAESEDERIRKELTTFLKNASGGLINTAIPCKIFGKWVAWLEKQVPIDEENCKGYQETDRCVVDGECEAKKSQRMISAEAKEALYDKPTWSDEDKEMLDSAIAFIEHSPFTTLGKGKGNAIGWLKSLKDRVQPKQE